MSRTDRLYALVEELRAKSPGPVSRRVLAATFEVNARTIERDILTLQQAGVPIWAERGRNGGYALEARWTLPPLNLDAAEGLALAAALSASANMPMGGAARRAALKLLAAMPPAEAEKARRLSSRVRIERAPAVGDPVVLSAIEDAVLNREVVELHYLDRTGEATVRPVEAHGLQITPTGTYLLAWCRLRDDERVFRLDRIGAVRPTGELAPERELGNAGTFLGESEPLLSNGEQHKVNTMPARPAGGPPRRADNQTGSSAEFAAAHARTFPSVEENTGRGKRSFAVGKRSFLTIENGTAALSLGDGTRSGGEEEFRVQLRSVGRDELRNLIDRAWRQAAPPKVAASHPRARRPAGLKLEDIRQIALALPSTDERVKSEGVHHFRVKGGLFAKFGEASNLIGPDLDDVLMIRSCEDRDALLESEPLRFFTTSHYENAILTRLSENSRRDLPEIRELLEASWLRLAPKRVARAWLDRVRP